MTSPSFSNWNFNIYTDIYSELVPFVSMKFLRSPLIPLPFERPCKKVCDDVTNNCLGLLGLFGFGQDCSARYDYSHGALAGLYYLNSSLQKPFQYDSSNNPNVCNLMNTTVPVAASKEPYLKAGDPTGACYGINQYLYVPPGNKVSSSLGPMQPPYVVQGIIENQLQNSISALPKWLSQKCHLALRKYFCGSYMLAPYTESMLAILNSNGLSTPLLNLYVSYGILPPAVLSYSFVVPSYPHYSVCTEYASACGEFIELAGLAALTPMCNASSGGVSSYPTSNQTILTAAFSLGGQSLKIDVKSPPNRMTTASDGTYTTSCPEGYVVPDAEDKRTTWIPGSGCALGCNWPSNTLEEWKHLNTVVALAAWIGLPVILLLILSWTLDPKKRKQYLVILFACYSSIATLTFCVSSSMEKKYTFCRTNAVGYSEGYGVKDPPNFCSAQALLLVFSGIGTAFSWAVLALDLFLKVALNYRSTQQFRVFFIGTPVVISSGLLIYASQNRYGYLNVLPFCFPFTYGDFYLIYYPMLLAAAVGVSCMVAVLFTIIRSILKTHGQSVVPDDANSKSKTSNAAAIAVMKKFHMLRIPLLFVFTFLFVLITYQTFRWALYSTRAHLTSSATDFTACIFEAYDGTNSWKKVCGSHPKKRISFQFSGFLMFCLAGQSVVLGSIYLLNPSVWAFWRDYLGITRVAKYISGKSGAGAQSEAVSEGGSIVVGGRGGHRKSKVSNVRKSVVKSSGNMVDDVGSVQRPGGGSRRVNNIPQQSMSLSHQKSYDVKSLVSSDKDGP